MAVLQACSMPTDDVPQGPIASTINRWTNYVQEESWSLAFGGMVAGVIALLVVVVQSDGPNPFQFGSTEPKNNSRPQSYSGGYTFPSGYHISPERARVYLGPEAQKEMRQFIREHEKREPTDGEVAFHLLYNERLENPRERANPKNYIP